MLLFYREASKYKTRQLIFEDHLYGRDPPTLEFLRGLTAQRRAVEGTINGTSHLTEAARREVHGGVTSRSQQDLNLVKAYLLNLEILLNHFLPAFQANEQRIKAFRKALQISWTSVLSLKTANAFSSTPRFVTCDDLRFEHVMTLWLYAALLRDCAMELLLSGSLDDARAAAKYLKDAAGVYAFVERELSLAGWSENNRALKSENMPEMSPTMAKAWGKIALAEAQAVWARIFKEQGKGLKVEEGIHGGAAVLFREALDLVASGTWAYPSEKFRRYLITSSVLHEARSIISQAARANERAEYGTELLLLRRCKERMAGKRPFDPEWQTVFERQEAELAELLRRAASDNDAIYRHKLPMDEEVPAALAEVLVAPADYAPSPIQRIFAFVT